MAWVNWTSISAGDVISGSQLEECRDNLDWIYAEVSGGLNRDGDSCGCDWDSYWPIKGQDEYGTDAYVISGGETGTQISGIRAVGNWGLDHRCNPYNSAENVGENTGEVTNTYTETGDNDTVTTNTYTESGDNDTVTTNTYTESGDNDSVTSNAATQGGQ